MQNDSFKMRQHYAPYNRSEESHRVSEKYKFRTFSVGLPRHFVPRNDNEQGDGSVEYFAALDIT